MDQVQKNLERALEEITLLHLEKKEQNKTIHLLQDEIANLKAQLNPPKTLELPTENRRINKILQEADEAMERYTNKLRKEGLKYAKQKQS